MVYVRNDACGHIYVRISYVLDYILKVYYYFIIFVYKLNIDPLTGMKYIYIQLYYKDLVWGLFQSLLQSKARNEIWTAGIAWAHEF